MRTFLSIIAPVIIGVLAVLFQLLGSPVSSATNLINGAEFIASLWLAIGGTYLYREKRFKDFAISALRRIMEIDVNLQRVLTRLEGYAQANGKTSAQFDLIREVLLSLGVTVSSAKIDWGEVIGDDIKKLEKAIQLGTGAAGLTDSARAEREKILNELPPTLELEAREVINAHNRIVLGVQTLEEELAERGFIEFAAFWDNTFEMDILSLEVGTTLHIYRDTVAARPSALVAHTEDGHSVGVIMNKGLGSNSYDEFAEMVGKFFEVSRFTAVYTEKGDITKTSDERERHYFTLRATL